MGVNKRKLGSFYEDKAADYLESQGYFILKRNYRCRSGEVDLIAKDGKYLVFVEVKYRSDRGRGEPEEAVTFQKQRRICRCSDWYRMSYGVTDDQPIRYDVVAVCGEEVRLLQNAFGHV